MPRAWQPCCSPPRRLLPSCRKRRSQRCLQVGITIWTWIINRWIGGARYLAPPRLWALQGCRAAWMTALCLLPEIVSHCSSAPLWIFPVDKDHRMSTSTEDNTHQSAADLYPDGRMDQGIFSTLA